MDQIVTQLSAVADVQAQRDRRSIPIQRVGIRAVRHPLNVATRNGRVVPTIGTWSLDVELPAQQRGTHMSRFIALIESFDRPISPGALSTLLPVMLTKLEAQGGRIEVCFPFFISKAAPVSGATSLMDYEIVLTAEGRDGAVKVVQKVRVPVTSLCPCSKEISRYGAHNQRSNLTIEAEAASELPVEDLIRIAEEEASCELWGLLKRADEKYVTERAYENAKFAEDIVRDVALRLNQDPRIAAYEVEVENFESIHNHSAFARLRVDKRLPPIKR